MTIPANITSELQNLQDQVAAATPLNNASFATIKAMQLNALNLVNDIQTALTASSLLDTWMPPTDPVALVSGFNTVVVAGNDQNNLSLMRGVVGRATSNLDQLV
jgi:hypothetical protein